MFDFEKFSVFSCIMLLAWLPFTFWRFTSVRPVKAAAQSLICGLLFLPEVAEFDFPVLPPIGKNVVAALAVYFGLKWKAPKRFKHNRQTKRYHSLFWLMCAGIVVTVFHNSEELIYGNHTITRIKPFELYDALYNIIDLFFKIWLPITLGRAIFKTKDDVADVLKTIVASCLFYTLFVLWELKMSPQLHNDIYGFYARSDFSQNIRQGGYRPTVFMTHGLLLAMFVYIAYASSLLMKRMGIKRVLHVPIVVVNWWLFVLLVLCKSMGPLLYGILTFIIFAIFSAKNQRKIAALSVMLVLTYPVARMFELISTDAIVELASDVFGPDRAQSLQFRFDNEDLLVTKGAEKLWFGWGSFGRDHVYDKDYGKDLTVQDGYWIIKFGQQGFFGFVCTYIFLTIPIVTSLKLRKLDNKSAKLVSGLVVIAAFSTINTLPNMDFPNLHLILMMGIATLAHSLKQQTNDKPAKI